MKFRMFDRLSIGLMVVTAALTAAVYPWLPDPIPTHFDAHGVANGYMPRAIGAWFGVVGELGLYLLLRFGHRLLPPEWRLRMQAPIVSLLPVSAKKIISQRWCGRWRPSPSMCSSYLPV